MARAEDRVSHSASSNTETAADSSAPRVLAGYDKIKEWQQDVYRTLHQHPELSNQELKTAATAAGALREAGYELHDKIGTTGVVGILRNGDGPTVLVRADMDALPMKEETGLPYASTDHQTDSSGQVVPVAHACGHDVHVASLMGAARLLAANRSAWHGPFLSTAASMRITVSGRGSHGSMPQLSIDPVVLAAMIVVRLQAIVAREVAPDDFAVLTIGPVTAGTKSNIIPDHAVIELNIRAYSDSTRTLLIKAIERSEDFSRIPDAFGVPYTYWALGGIDAKKWHQAEAAGTLATDIPANHSPQLAPVIEPTLNTGTAAIVVAALAWLSS